MAGIAGRRNVRRGLRLFTACDHFGRSLARSAERYRIPPGSQEFADAFMAAAVQTQRNIDGLVTAIDGAHAPVLVSATDELDRAESLARQHDGEAEPASDTRRFLTAVHALRQIERAVITTATNLGARDRIRVPSPAVS